MAKLGNSISGVIEKPHNNLLAITQDEGNSIMSRPLKTTLVALLMITASSIFMQDNNGNASKMAKAAETLTAPRTQASRNAIQDQIRQLLLDRKRLLERHAEEMKKSLEYGRGSLSDYTQARITALLAGIDLCDTTAERIEIHSEVIKFWKEIEKAMERDIARGQRPAIKINKIRVARLEAEVDLLKEQLKE